MVMKGVDCMYDRTGIDEIYSVIKALSCWPEELGPLEYDSPESELSDIIGSLDIIKEMAEKRMNELNQIPEKKTRPYYLRLIPGRKA